jgi:hypothetical protein
MAKKVINLSVEVGYELRTVSLTEEEYAYIKSGKQLVKEVEDHYEGEKFTYEFNFNNPTFENDTLVVSYDGADGFIGEIEDAYINEELN